MNFKENTIFLGLAFPVLPKDSFQRLHHSSSREILSAASACRAHEHEIARLAMAFATVFFYAPLTEIRSRTWKELRESS